MEEEEEKKKSQKQTKKTNKENKNTTVPDTTQSILHRLEETGLLQEGKSLFHVSILRHHFQRMCF